MKPLALLPNHQLIIIFICLITLTFTSTIGHAAPLVASHARIGTVFSMHSDVTSSSPHHARMGSHGMVLFTDGTTLYASHMPLYSKPHDYQLIYQISTDRNKQIISALTKGKAETPTRYATSMLTLLPKPFDLNTLVKEQALTISATVFKGHFERGGTPWLTEIEVKFTKVILNEQLIISPKKHSLNKGIHQWRVIPLHSSSDKLFVHLIDDKPSFDAIVLGKNCPNTASETINNAKLKREDAHLHLETYCQQQTILYYEKHDFAE